MSGVYAVSSRVVGIPRTPGNLPGSALLLTNGGSFPQSRVFGNYNSQLLTTGQCTFPDWPGLDECIGDLSPIDRNTVAAAEIGKANVIDGNPAHPSGGAKFGSGGISGRVRWLRAMHAELPFWRTGGRSAFSKDKFDGVDDQLVDGHGSQQ